nr:uncharacterized protein LOC123768466 [Procambarus clarkii]
MKMRALTCIMLLWTLNGATAWFCYTHNVGAKSWSVAFCPSVSCYSVGAKVLGIGDSQKGCADQVYPSICQSASFQGLAGEHACFCNTFLCNTSSMPSIFMPLLIVPWLLQRLI